MFTATKNADQPLAIWRMVEKIAFSTEKKSICSYHVMPYVFILKIF